MGLVSSWEQRGIEQSIDQGLKKDLQQGLHDGKEESLTLQLQQRFSTLTVNITERLDQLTSEQLNELAKAVFGFTSLDDLE